MVFCAFSRSSLSARCTQSHASAVASWQDVMSHVCSGAGEISSIRSVPRRVMLDMRQPVGRVAIKPSIIGFAQASRFGSITQSAGSQPSWPNGMVKLGIVMVGSVPCDVGNQLQVASLAALVCSRSGKCPSYISGFLPKRMSFCHWSFVVHTYDGHHLRRKPPMRTAPKLLP